MQTNISAEFKNTVAGQEAESILRSCVHCGFCTATCPTYQILGDELDSPRGRIYLIKQMLEGQAVSQSSQTHLDRCLTCRACETTCPSGVEYSHLLEIGRELVDQRVKRPLVDRLQRWLLCNLLPYPKRFSILINTGRLFKTLVPFLLPHKIKKSIPNLSNNLEWQIQTQKRKMLILNGCVQPSLSPEINASASRVLNRLGIELIVKPMAQCCGAVNQHLNDKKTANKFIKQNIDNWYPSLASGESEALIITASGCGAMVKEYAHILKDDPDYAEKAKLVSQTCKDISEILANEDLSQLSIDTKPHIAFHSPCTLQHAQQLNGVVEGILSRAGFTLNTIKDAHLCCGSAGTYSILQKELSQQLKINKLAALEANQPNIIATANIGCLHHLASDSSVKVKHWIELLDSSST